MPIEVPELICDNNLSYAWGRAFLHVFEQRKKILTPLVVTIEGLEDGVPAEDLLIRNALDSSLQMHKGKFCSDVTATTIFPFRWSDTILSKPRSAMYDLYITGMLPRLKVRGPQNRYGTYFERMIAYTGTKKKGGKYILKPVNQLEQIITDWNRERHSRKRPRHSALQIACFDPAKDHTGQSMRGFPCLQQISLLYDDDDCLALTAFYPTQFMYDRAYGNYLGLCRLGRYLAREMELVFVRLTCFIGHPYLGNVTKRDIRAIESTVREILASRTVDDIE